MSIKLKQIQVGKKKRSHLRTIKNKYQKHIRNELQEKDIKPAISYYIWHRFN